MARKERNKIIPAVFLLLRRDDEVLLLRRAGTGFQDGQYTFPSGHVEANEPPSMAICREAKEEARVIVKPEDLTFEQVLYRHGFNITGDGFDHSQPERVDFFFSTREWEGEPAIGEPNKCDDVRWFPLSALPNNLFPIVRTFLEGYPNPTSYREAGY